MLIGQLLTTLCISLGSVGLSMPCSSVLINPSDALNLAVSIEILLEKNI